MNKKLFTAIIDRIKSITSSAGRPVWLREFFLYSVTLLLTLADATNLYKTFESLLAENPIMLFVLTATTAFCLDFTPLLLGRIVQAIRYKKKSVQPWMIVSLLVFYGLLFSTTFALRWTTRDALVSTGLEGISGLDISASALESAPATGVQNIVLALQLGILPLITSAVTFYIGVLSDDIIQKEINDLTIEKAKAEDEKSTFEAACIELEKDWANILSDLDAEQKASAEAHQKDITRYIETLIDLYVDEKINELNNT